MDVTDTCMQLPDGTRGRVALQWEGTAYRGIACDMTSTGFKALSEATREVIGECKPYAETGALVSVTLTLVIRDWQLICCVTAVGSRLARTRL